MSEDKTIDVFECVIHGSKLIEDSKGTVIAFIQAELDNLEDGEIDDLEIMITRKKMDLKAYNELPEFDGF